jgi:hypothetical protein
MILKCCAGDVDLKVCGVGGRSPFGERRLECVRIAIQCVTTATTGAVGLPGSSFMFYSCSATERPHSDRSYPAKNLEGRPSDKITDNFLHHHLP